MPSKLWDIQSDWQTWDLTQLVASADGYLEIEEGYADGTAVSPIYEAANWKHASLVRVVGVVPTGTNIRLRFKSAVTSEGIAGASWSDYVDGFDDNGVFNFDIRSYIINESYVEGAFVQFELTLEGE